MLKYFDGSVVYVAQDGGLACALTETSVIQKLSITGTPGAADLQYIRENLSSPETFDLSGADMAAFPKQGLGFSGGDNTTLKKVVLPEGMTAIGDAAFANCTVLTEVNLLSTVTSGGKYMLQGTAVESATIHAPVTTLQMSCFQGAGITSLVIPANVPVIETWAFASCDHLQSVVIEANITEISETGFAYLNSLTSVTFPASVREIGADAFNQCKVDPLVLPASLEISGDRAFSNNALTGVPLPDKVTTIGNSAFYWNQIETIDLPASLTSLGGTAFEWKYAKTVICRAVHVPVVVATANNPTPFNGEIQPDCILKVPAASRDAYKAAWGSYFTIIEAIQ